MRLWTYGGESTAVLEGTLTGHSKPVTALAFSSDGSLLATGSLATDVTVWDVISQQGKHRLKVALRLVVLVCFRFAHNRFDRRMI